MKKILIAFYSFLFFCSVSWAGISFDGVDDFCSNSSIAVGAGDAITVTYWEYQATADVQEAASWGIGTAQTTDRALAHSPWSDGNIYFDYGNLLINGRATYSMTSYYDQWVHVALVSGGGTGARKIYINGTEVYTNASSDSPLTTHTGLSIGRALINAPDKYTKSRMTNFAVWKGTVLTANEISQIANSRNKRIELQIKKANLLAFYPLDDEEDGSSADGDTFKDLSGNGYDMTCDNGANNTGLTAKAEEILSYP